MTVIEDGIEETIETDEVVEVDEEVVETDTSIEEAEAGEVDPWEALKAKKYDPLQLEKSHTRFTQELESVKEMERELAPYRQLKELMDTDERVLEAFQNALNEPMEGESEVDVVKRELDSMKQQMATEREVETLKAYVKDNDLPELNEQAVIQHAIKNQIGNLKSAYNDMNFDLIRQAERDKAFKDVKSNKRAKAVGSGGSTGKAAPAFTQEQISQMTPSQFDENRNAIMAYYESLRG